MLEKFVSVTRATLKGTIMLFGAMGFILGPILATLFVTTWEMFGIAFRTSIAEPETASGRRAPQAPPLVRKGPVGLARP